MLESSSAENPEQAKFEIRHSTFNGRPMEVWVNKDTAKVERVLIHLKTGHIQELIYTGDDEEKTKYSLYDKDGTLVYFEDSAAMRHIQEEEEKLKEKGSAFPTQVLSVDEIKTKLDRKLLEGYLPPDAKGQ